MDSITSNFNLNNKSHKTLKLQGKICLQPKTRLKYKPEKNY